MAVTAQPGEGMVLVSLQGTRGWTSGLCNCFKDCNTCLCTCLCLPCMTCRVAQRMHECLCLPCLAPMTLMAFRTKLRTMGGIKGSICRDCCATCCCWPCTLCQLSRELDAMGL